MIFLIAIIFLLPQLMHADEAAKMRQAAVYFEGKEFAQADQVYQSILQENQISWQRAIILYNLACTLLEEQKFEKAIETFNAIILEEQVLPELAYRLKCQLAFAYWEQGLFFEGKQNYSKASDSYQNALKVIPEAQTAYCRLIMIEGETTCKPIIDLNTLEMLVQKRLKNVNSKKESTQPQTPTPSEPETKAPEIESQKTESEKKSENDVLRLLLEMEQDDALPKQQITNRKEELRPW